MSNPAIAKHYTRILSLWPKDALRPNLPFHQTIERHALPYGVKPVSPPPSQKPSSATPSAPPAPSSPEDERAKINALFSLLENRYSKRYPLSPDVLKPSSNPEHYDRLMKEIERAPHKSWWQAKLDEWKGKIRWE